MIRSRVEDWQVLSALYERADELDDASLAAWLDQLAVENEPLLPQLRRMLAARSLVRDADFLGSLPPLSAIDAPLAAHPIEADVRIGPYRLLRHIGRGGMAEVWLARRDDGAFERQVAIKLLFRHTSSTERDTFAQRFARERDIVASLHHPNIAGLHDAGVTAEGQPWLALEYVEGEPITAWCDRRRLDVSARVRLFRQVLLAVQHAHANLVIHRDLKPANILVTDDGEVRLLDFGIAKLQEVGGGALEETELTRQSGRPLTLHYASPEQILGRPLSTACDIYALGVVLYELLCGERPYELKTASAAQVEQAILEADPKPPSRRLLTADAASLRGSNPGLLRKVLAPDLDAIVLKAMAKLAPERYPSVDAFGTDLELWRSGLPVAATHPTQWRRTVKFVKRHAVGVSLSATSVLVLIGIATVAVMMGAQARIESARAVAAKDFLLDMFRAADPNQAKGASITAREILAAGEARAGKVFATQPELYAELLSEIGTVQRRLGYFPAARDTLERVAEAHRRSGRQAQWAGVTIELAWTLLQMGEPTKAIALLDEASDTARRYPLSVDTPIRLAEVQGWSYRWLGRFPEARRAMDEGLAKALSTYGRRHIRTVDLLRGIAAVEGDVREYGAALVHIDQAADALRSLANAPPNDLVNVVLEKALIQWAAGDYGASTAGIILVAERCDALLGSGAVNCRFARVMQATMLLRVGRRDEAVAMRPLLLRIESETEAPGRQAEVLETLCRVLCTKGGDVRTRLERLAASGPEVKVTDDFKAAGMLALAEASLFSGDTADAGAWLGRFLQRHPVPDAANPTQFAEAKVLGGVALQMEGRHSEALSSFRDADRSMAIARGTDHTLSLLYRLNQATSLRATGRRSEALALIDGTLPLLRERIGASAPVVMRAESLRSRLSSEGPGTDTSLPDFFS